MSQLKIIYKEEVVPKLIETFKYKSIMQVPRLKKIVRSTGGKGDPEYGSGRGDS